MKNGPFENISMQDDQAMIDCNVYHYCAFIKKFLPELLERSDETTKSGLIVVSSGTGYVSCPNMLTYAATKGLINFLVLSL